MSLGEQPGFAAIKGATARLSEQARAYIEEQKGREELWKNTPSEFTLLVEIRNELRGIRELLEKERSE